MKLKEIIDTIDNGIIQTSDIEIEKRANQIKAYYKDIITKVSISDSLYGGNYYIIGSIHDLSDQTELYNEMYIEDDDGYTIFDICMVSIEEL